MVNGRSTGKPEIESFNLADLDVAPLDVRLELTTIIPACTLAICEANCNSNCNDLCNGNASCHIHCGNLTSGCGCNSESIALV